MIQDKIDEFFKLIELRMFKIDESKIVFFDESGITLGTHSIYSFRKSLSLLSRSITMGLNNLELNNLIYLKNILKENLHNNKEFSIDDKTFYLQNEIEVYFLHIEDAEITKINLEDLSIENLNIIQEFRQLKDTVLQNLIKSIDDHLEKKNSMSLNHEKLEIKLSVGDIALLFRLLDEENLITYKHKTEIYKHIAETLKTEKQNNISEASIKNKFLSPDNSSIKNLDFLLINLRQHLKKIQ